MQPKVEELEQRDQPSAFTVAQAIAAANAGAGPMGTSPQAVYNSMQENHPEWALPNETLGTAADPHTAAAWANYSALFPHNPAPAPDPRLSAAFTAAPWADPMNNADLVGAAFLALKLHNGF